MRPGLVDIIETSYRFEDTPESWIKSLGEVVDAHLGFGLGLVAIRYRIGTGTTFEPLSMTPVNMPADAVAAVQRGTENLPASYVSRTFASLPCDTARASGPADVRAFTRQVFREHFEPNGWNDCMTINGLDPTNNGLCLAVWLPRRKKMTPYLRTRWSRVAAHVAAAHRLRTRLGPIDSRRPDSAEAVLTPGGQVEHAVDEAKLAGARERLRESVRALERVRGKLRRTDPDLAVAGWKGLVDARWTLVDHFESDGKRFLLARRNEAVEQGAESLTTREYQAVGFARLGHTNKLIAYEMGITASTVGVLLHRAASKLRARTRAELIAIYTRVIGA